jgi:4-hydroxybenzoate polyprenyltransferase
MQKKEWFRLIRAMRIERSLMPLSFIMIAVGFANKMTSDIVILMVCCVMMYTVGGLINAKADKDFSVKNINIAIFALLLLSVLFSTANLVIFFAVCASLLMGFAYNRVFRFFIFGDSIALSITHVIIPIVSSSLILGLGSKVFLPVIALSAIPFSLITPMKNLRGIKGDKKRKYHTLMTKYKNGKQITQILLSIYFIAVFLAYFFFNLSKKFLVVVVFLFVIKIFMDYYLNTSKEIVAYGLVRLVIIILPFAFVFDKATDPLLLMISLSFITGYFLYFISNVKQALKSQYV